jgi:hypothetical protein
MLTVAMTCDPPFWERWLWSASTNDIDINITSVTKDPSLIVLRTERLDCNSESVKAKARSESIISLLLQCKRKRKLTRKVRSIAGGPYLAGPLLR